MKLKNIYKSDINRSLNGVIKVAQEDEYSIKQELEEYIITKELRTHFATFLNNYEKSIYTPTDKIGVWISGFFGSGKSHFLKILSYVLSNKIVAGRQAVEYFADKFDDPMMFAQLERCASVPTDAILFNIDSKSPIEKDKTAILRVFAKVFYEHLGFYGTDLKVAKLESFITKSGNADAFKQKFAQLNGQTWEQARDSFAFFEDDVVEALTETLGMSESAAKNWFNGTETAEMSIEQLVKEIKTYVESRGKDYRLLFMIDEVGQYIGSDSDLMLNLQTIVEEIGTQCYGRVWVMVTSQEAIDSITKVSGNDFSKIQGRFNTRLSLSSSSVDEVIKKRILAKNENAEALLRMSYEKNSAVLKNLFTFNNAVLDLKGYSGEADFVESYPFVPYQFRLMQNVLTQIRKHGNSGKHLSAGERSMLSGFQEAAQEIQDKDENALVPFSLFYKTVHTFLESTIRRVIDRCQTAADNGNGIEQYDVEILKLLYLIRYVDDVKGNVDSITTLMVEDIRADKINMRKAVQESLDRLYSQNYIDKNGDTYIFLTDEEQDIAREIRNTSVDSSSIVQSIAHTVFADIYVNKKYRLGKYDFAYDQFADDTAMGQVKGPIGLRLITVASNLYQAGEENFIMKSGVNHEVIVVLSDRYPYFDELENAMKIRKYAKGSNVAKLSETQQIIIRNRQQEAFACEKRAKSYISQAIVEGSFYVAGERLQIKGSTAIEKLDNAMELLVRSVYTKLDYVTSYFEDDSEILGLLSEENQQMSMGQKLTTRNPEAVAEVEQYLRMQAEKHMPTSMGDIHKRFSGIPFGWREIDIAGIVATLIRDKKVTIQYSGTTIQPKDKKMADYLRRRTEIDKTMVKRRENISGTLMKQSREFLREYFNVMDVPDDEDDLIEFVIKEFEVERIGLESKMHAYKQDAYPGKSVVENSIKLCNKLLLQKKDNTVLLKTMVSMADDFLDQNDEMSDVTSFFKNQKDIFDQALKKVADMERENEYIQIDGKATDLVRRIKEILHMEKPYKRITELPDLMQEIDEIYGQLLIEKREEIHGEVQAAMAEVHQTANQGQLSIVDEADSKLISKRMAADEEKSLTALDAMKPQIASIRQYYLKALVVSGSNNGPEKDVVTVLRSNICHVSKLESPEDIDEYLAEVRKKLLNKLEGHDVLHII